MTLEQLLPWITGSGGALAILAWVAWDQKKKLDKLNGDVQEGRMVPRERLDEMRDQRDAALTRMDKALDNAESTARAIEERNRVEAARLADAKKTSFSEQIADTETQMRRPRTRT